MPNVHCKRHCGLNPFEFRAGIYFGDKGSIARTLTVLIPLNSGLVFTFRVHRARCWGAVLIPLNSGLVFTCRIPVGSCMAGLS